MVNRGEEVSVALKDLDRATTELGARVQGLIDQINATEGEGLTADQTEAALVQLAGFKTVLDAMGHNPGNPLPPLPPLPNPVE